MFLKVLFFCLFPLISFATGQVGDRLIWNGDTLLLFSNPLETHPDIHTLRPKIFGTQSPSFHTGCWHGYIAEWEIINNRLYLSNIFSCDYPTHKIKADLASLFSQRLDNGKIASTWFTGTLLIPKGKLLYYQHIGYESIYEKEIEVTLKNGILTKTQEFDNTQTQLSIYSENSDSLLAFIAQNINWKILPDLGKQSVKVFAKIVSSTRPLPDDVQLLKKADEEIFNTEALRVLQSLPSWSCYFKRGKVYKIPYFIPIVFDENRRKKYLKP